jgi:hypothetical protein
MDHAEEQQEILQRLGETSARFEAAYEQVKGTHDRLGKNVVVAAMTVNEIAGMLNTTINDSNELFRLYKEYGDVWREYLDSLAKG